MRNSQNQIQVFNFNENDVRVSLVGSDPWFVAKDVCQTLSISKHRDAVSRLDEDERGSVLVDTLGGPQNVAAVNESGLYSLIFQSRKPEAKIFKRWVTHEVLPAIRKHGIYATAPTLEKMITSPDFIIKLATSLKEEKEGRIKAESDARRLEGLLDEAVPKIHYYNDVLQSKDTLTTTQIAKELGMSGLELNKRLNNLGMLYKQSGQWMLYARYQGKQLTKTRTHAFTDEYGNQRTNTYLVWTQKGRQFIHLLIKGRMSSDFDV